MTKFVLIRGASAVGKTTISKKILKTLKVDHKIDCAYICEDDFRKQMQFKYKAKDMAAHENSVVLIKTIIQKLMAIDNYQIIFIEGQFRYKNILEKYKKFFEENNFEYKIFQLSLDLEIMKKRDLKHRNSKSEDIEEVKKDIEKYIPKECKIIETKKSVEETVDEIISMLL